jgi:hypothetical protein
MLCKMGEVGLLARGIDDNEEVVAAVVDHQVVENAAGFIGEQRIALPAGGEAEYIDGNEGFECAGGVCVVAGLRLHDDLAHVRHVEQAGGSARMQMFLQNAGGILHRHVIAGKGHHAGAKLQMERVKRGLLQICLDAQERVSGQGRESRRLIRSDAVAPVSP